MQDPMITNDLFKNDLLWEQIFDALPDMVFVINRQHQILYKYESPDHLQMHRKRLGYRGSCWAQGLLP